jgi:two-component system, LytTR family, response regulator
MTLQAVIVDDEPSGRKALLDSCRSHPHIEVLAECTSGVEAIDLIRAKRPHVAFLDVQMKPITGIEVAAQLPPEDTPVIVFVTAYDQYAVRAFELNAVDYLLKPFDAGRFGRMLERVRTRVGDRLTLEARQEARNLVLAAARELRTNPRSGEAERLIIEVGGRVSFVDPLDVEYIEVDRNYVIIATKQQSYRVRATLAEIEERLTLPRFVRVHRSVIINIAMIESVEKWFHGEYGITLRSGRRFTSGRTYRHRMQGLLLRRRSAGD